MVESVITRFAPSPTGYLHIGGARTALFNYVFSKKHNGKFYLRIEDTDQARSKKEFVVDIINSLTWLGLNWDNAIIYQSTRTEIYQKYLDELIEKNFAYRCYCSIHELEEKRKLASLQKKKPMYDRTCRNIKIIKDLPYVIRFATPLSGNVTVNDAVKEEVIFSNEEIDDFIIRRQDGTFSYNFVSVIDDIEMGVTHVIRGDDHLNNTPKQINIYNALNKKTPIFAHIPLILGQDKARLSKRHGATSVNSYKEQGFLPDALVNFLMRIGWAYKDEEIFTLNNIIKKFSLRDISKSHGVFNFEKLLWLNGYYIRERDNACLLEEVKSFINNPDTKNLGNLNALELIGLCKTRAKTLVELGKLINFYFSDKINYNEEDLKKHVTDKIKKPLEELVILLEQEENFTKENINNHFNTIIQKYNLTLTDLAQAVRVLLTGLTVSPGIFETMEILGKERTLQRLK
jgi:glutamyl-tRNA synthetase